MIKHTFYIIPIILIVACDSSKSDLENQQEAKKAENQQEIIVGERIDGPANIREEINGRLLFSLNDSVGVQTGLIENDWYPVGLWIDVTKEQEKLSRLLPGQAIYVGQNKVGQVLDTVGIWTENEGKGFITGMTFKDNIIRSTIPEVYIASLINQKKTTVQEIKPFMNALYFEPDDSWSNKELEAYFLYEEFIVDPSPMDRITLLFKNDNLVAINHSRQIDLPDYKSYQLDRNYTLTITGDLSDEEVNQLIEDRNHWVNSVD